MNSPEDSLMCGFLKHTRLFNVQNRRVCFPEHF